MMLRLTKNKIILITILWQLVFLALSLTGYNHFQLLNIVGFLTLVFLPGFLTVLLFRLDNLPFWAYVALTVAFSLLELMVVALIGNTLLPHFGILRPLDKKPLLIEFFALVNLLLLFVTRFEREVRMSLYSHIIFKSMKDTIIALFPLVFVVLSIFGAIRLNNGGNNILIMVMLGGMAVYIGFLIYYSKKAEENVLQTAIFLMTISLLLMTSLRGWYITGHDIQREYKVFQLARNNGLWSMANYRDPYNACLSITILPTLFSNLIPLPGQYIFKFLFQLVFALVPVLVYLIGRHWTSRKISLIGTLYFISFPTFFIDMPYLVRQETAFVFYGLMLYLIFEPKIDLRIRRLLFVIMGIGVILSHYSTTYIVLIIFGAGILSRPLFIKLFKYLKTKKLFANSALSFSSDDGLKKPKITYTIVVILFVLSFCWTSLITHTGNGISNVFTQTISAVTNGFGQNNKSTDATRLLTFAKSNPDQQIKDYITTIVDPIHNAGAPGEYFSPDTYSQYQIRGLPEETVPVSGLGKFLSRITHIDISNVVQIFGQIFAKLSEIIIPIGIIYLMFRKNVIKYIEPEVYLLSIFALIFIALNIFLPVLSVQYGIFRAMQQAMFIIAPIMVLGTIAIGRGIAVLIKPLRKNLAMVDTVSAATFILLFFLYTTAFAPQLVGGNVALLHLNNAGTYYNDFYTRGQEVEGIDWLADRNPTIVDQIQFDVQSDRFSSSKVTSISNLTPYNDIFPSVVKRNAYLFLSYSNVNKQIATELFSGDRINYTYPLEFLDKNKDLLYNNNGSRVYR